MTISNLEDAAAWLKTVQAGQKVSVGSALFNAPVADVLFKQIPGLDPVVLEVIAVDPAGYTLTGTTTILGESGTTAVFTFSQAKDNGSFLITLRATLPADLAWTLTEGLDVGFEDLTATFATNATLTALTLQFDSTLALVATRLPVRLIVPTSPDGDWQLSARTDDTTWPKALTTADLTQIGNNTNPLSVLGSAFETSHLELTNLAFSFTSQPGTLTSFALGFSYTNDSWQFFDGSFELRQLTFAVKSLYPFDTGATWQAAVGAQMAIGPVDADVELLFPGAILSANLAPDKPLSVADVFTAFQTTAPDVLKAIEISRLQFAFELEAKRFDFHLAISKPFALFADIEVERFEFDLGVEGGQTFVATGSIYAGFKIGGTELILSGDYASDSVAVSGIASDIPLGEIISDLAQRFGVAESDVPKAIKSLELQSISVSAATGTAARFAFDLAGTIEIADVTVGFAPSIHLTKTSAGWDKIFGGTITITSGSDVYTFDVTYETGPTTDVLLATLSIGGDGLTFEKLASAFHFTLPDIPSSLDLDLQQAGFEYDFNTGTLAFGLQSKTYGKATFVSPKTGNDRVYVFMLDTGSDIELSNLPLIGEELASIQTAALKELKVAVASLATLGTDTAATVNAAIAKLNAKTPGYPTVPDTGLAGRVLLTASLVIGTSTTPINLSLGGGASDSRTPATSDTVLVEAAAATGASASAATSPNSPSWFNVQRSFGPLSIQRIGLLYQSDRQALWVEIDASLAIGPLTAGLDGLGIGSSLASFKPEFFLGGLDIQYNQPPLYISGQLVNLQPPGASGIAFAGSIVVEASEFSLVGSGYYGNVNGFNSLFLFLEASLPIGGPPQFQLSGLAGGFGFNSDVRLPTVDTLDEFPFVVVLPASPKPNPGALGTTPLDALKSLTQGDNPWVHDTLGQKWIAAGISFTSFEVLHGSVMLLVEFGTELEIALLGVASASFPPAGNVYAQIVLDVAATFLPARGEFTVAAVLAPSSFLLDRKCMLTGGFAFSLWYGPSQHAGDFVFTAGGYHPAFTPPAWYPRVPRVGFNWSLDSSVTVSGGSYLAIVPAAFMAGVALDITFQSGNLRAWLNAHADVLIRFTPFWFDAEIGIRIGASYRLNLLFTSVTLTVELGCDLELWGPPTGGEVTVDWTIISFTIPFGTSKDAANNTLQAWSDVAALLPATGPAANKSLLSANAVTGLSASKEAKGDAAGEWTVRAGAFSFSTGTPIPATKVTVGSGFAEDYDAFHVHPLNWTGVTATHAVTFRKVAGPGRTALAATEDDDHTSAFEIAANTGQAPVAIWGNPATNGGKQIVPNPDQLLLNDVFNGVTLSAKPPVTGTSAGPISIDDCLSTTDLLLTGAKLPINPADAATGPVATVSPTTIATIIAPDAGIASAATVAARGTLFAALNTAGFTLAGNDNMQKYAAAAGVSLTAVPLLTA